MKYLISVICIIIMSCESNSSSEVNISKGYVFLNQGQNSSIDYYNLDSDSLIQGVFQRNNASEVLAGYAEHLNKSDDLITITLQGSFGTGEGGKVVLNG